MQIFFSDHFKRQLKKLMKPYPHAKEDLLKSLNDFRLETALSISRSIYKIRIKSQDIAKGKSGGFRAYIYCYRKKDLLVPLCIYAKSEQSPITDNELQYHFDKTTEELLQTF